MAYQPTCLEDSLDAWIEGEQPESQRCELVIHWLMDLCAADGRKPGHAIPGMKLPAYVARVPGAEVVVAWVVVDRFTEVAVRRLLDLRSQRWYGL